MTMRLLDPTDQRDSLERAPRGKPRSIKGLKVGLLDISKARGDVFLDRLETHFRAEGVEVLRFKKPTFTRPAPIQLIQEIAGRCDLVVEGLAD